MNIAGPLPYHINMCPERDLNHRVRKVATVFEHHGWINTNFVAKILLLYKNPSQKNPESKLCVVYFEQHWGAMHTEYWSKSPFSHLFNILMQK